MARPVCLFLYRIIHKSLRDIRPLQYSSRDGHTEREHVNRGREHVNRGRDTPRFCCTLQVLDMSFCCVWLGCCAAEFGSSGGTYELSCISIFAFITRVEFAYGAFRFQYVMGKHVTTGQRVITHIYVCGPSYASCLFFHTVFLQ
jgi:hypothetical protein